MAASRIMYIERGGGFDRRLTGTIAALWLLCAIGVVTAQSPWPQGPPFRTIAAVAGFPDDPALTNPSAIEVRASAWNGLGHGPFSFVRIVVDGERLTVQRLRWWDEGMSRRARVAGATTRCDDVRRTCLELFVEDGNADWRQLAMEFAASGPCRAPYVPSPTRPPPPPPADSHELHAEITANAVRRDYSCRDPENARGPGAQSARALFRLLNDRGRD